MGGGLTRARGLTAAHRAVGGYIRYTRYTRYTRAAGAAGAYLGCPDR